MGKESACKAGDAGDAGSIPGSGRSSGEGDGKPLQYSWLENPMDRGAWQATIRGIAQSRTRLKRLSSSPYIFAGDKESACSAGVAGDAGLIPGQEDPLKEAWQPTPVFLAGESHGQRNLEGFCP